MNDQPQPGQPGPNYQPQPNYPQGFQPQPGYQPMPAPKKKGRVGKFVALGCGIPVGLFILIGIIVGVAGGGNKTPAQPTGAPLGNQVTTQAQPPAAQPPAQPAKPAEHTVVYTVSGTGKASITYVTDGMTTTNQESDVPLSPPWTKTITLPKGKALQMVSIVAQGDGTGAVKIMIMVDGKLYKEASATGYGVATASGNIGTMG